MVFKHVRLVQKEMGAVLICDTAHGMEWPDVFVSLESLRGRGVWGGEDRQTETDRKTDREEKRKRDRERGRERERENESARAQQTQTLTEEGVGRKAGME